MFYWNRLPKRTVERDDATTVYAPNMLIAFIKRETQEETQYVSVEVVDMQSH